MDKKIESLQVSGYLSIKQLCSKLNVSRDKLRRTLYKLNITSSTKIHNCVYYSSEQIKELETYYKNLSPPKTISRQELTRMIGLKHKESIRYWIDKLGIKPSRTTHNRVLLTYEQAIMILPNIKKANKILVDKAMLQLGSQKTMDVKENEDNIYAKIFDPTRCPKCDTIVEVVDVRRRKSPYPCIYRRKKCIYCGYRFSTTEVAGLPSEIDIFKKGTYKTEQPIKITEPKVKILPRIEPGQWPDHINIEDTHAKAKIIIAGMKNSKGIT